MRLSHGRPNGHRPTVRPSVRYHPRDNPGAEVVGAVAVGVISGSPRRIFFCWLQGFVAAAAAANHPRGVEVVGAMAAEVISGRPAAFFFQKFRG
jgi:hypothetical protein